MRFRCRSSWRGITLTTYCWNQRRPSQLVSFQKFDSNVIGLTPPTRRQDEPTDREDILRRVHNMHSRVLLRGRALLGVAKKNYIVAQVSCIIYCSSWHKGQNIWNCFDRGLIGRSCQPVSKRLHLFQVAVRDILISDVRCSLYSHTAYRIQSTQSTKYRGCYHTWYTVGSTQRMYSDSWSLLYRILDTVPFDPRVVVGIPVFILNSCTQCSVLSHHE